MKRAWLVPALLVSLSAAAAQGCIFVSDDDDDDGNVPTPDASIPPPDATPVPTQGVFQTTWTLTQGGAAVACGDVGAASVSFLSTAATTNMGYDDVFTCTDMAGNTAPLPLDDYQISVSILDAMEQVLGQTPNPLQATFDTCDSIDGVTCLVALPNIEFAF
jgi:hypothetical protein